MKFLCLCIALVSFALSLDAGEPRAVSVPVVYVRKGPQIDGLLGDSAWKKSFRSAGFCAGEQECANGASTLRLLYSDTSLYVAVSFNERADMVSCRKGGCASPEGYGDIEALNVYVRPNPDSEECFLFAANTKDKFYRCGSSRGELKKPWKSAIKKTRTGGSLEFEIPFASLNVKTPEDRSNWEIAVSCTPVETPKCSAKACGAKDSALKCVSFSKCVFLNGNQEELSVRIMDTTADRPIYISPMDIQTVLPSVAPARDDSSAWVIPSFEFSDEKSRLIFPERRIGVLAKFEYMGWFARVKAFPVNSGIVDLDRKIFRGGAPDKNRDPLDIMPRLKKLGIRRFIVLCGDKEQGVDVDNQAAIARDLGMTIEKFSWTKLANEKRAGKAEPTWARIKKSILDGNVYIQCVWGCDRTGGIVGRLRREFYGWTKEEAQMELTIYGFAGNITRDELLAHQKERLWYFDFPLEKYMPLPELRTQNPLAPVVFVGTGPKIDGDLGDDAWKKSFRLSGFRPTQRIAEGGFFPARQPTTMMMLYSDTSLYLGFDCRKIPPVKGPVAYVSEKRERDGHCWRDDSLSLFIEPLLGGEDYFLLITNVLGDVYDGKLRSSEWNSALWKKAVKKTDTGWVVEFEIPFAVMGAGTPAEGDVWGFSPVRQDVAYDESSAWAPITWDWHNRGRYGRCVFLKKIDGSFAVQIAGASGKPVYSRKLAGIEANLPAIEAPHRLRQK